MVTTMQSILQATSTWSLVAFVLGLAALLQFRQENSGDWKEMS